MAGKLNKTKMLAVCDELAKGKSLRAACDNDPKLPAWNTVLQAVQRDEDLHEMYVRARAIGAEVLADEMFELAREPLDPNDKQMANAEVQRRRVEIDTMKWCFARMQPRGIRNKAEDVPANAGTITLNWGGGVDEAVAPVEQQPAQVVKLVPKGSDDG